MTRLQLETDSFAALVHHPEHWCRVNVEDFQTSDFRSLLTDFLGHSKNGRAYTHWIEYLKGQSKAQPLFRDILSNAREMVGAFDRYALVLRSGGDELPPIASLSVYLDEVERFVTKYVVFPSEHEPIAVALWIAHSWLVESFDVSPILAITSAEKRSGKTRVLDCMKLLVPNPKPSIIPSEAVVFFLLSERPRPTLLLDEADAIFNARNSDRFEGLRAIFNSGNAKGTPVPRVKYIKGKREAEWFDVFGAKAIAGIGALPPTIADRSIHIRLKRRAPTEQVKKFRRRIAEQEAVLITFDWNGLHLESTASVPDELNDRQADSWEPLLAIADAAAGGWAERARRAAIALSGEEENISTGMKLLADIKEVFREGDHLEVSVLLERLHELDTWSDYYGRPLTAKALGSLLGSYRISSRLTRATGKPERRYFRSDFEDSWRRYLPASVTNVTTVTTADSVTDVTDVTDVQEGKTLAHELPF